MIRELFHYFFTKTTPEARAFGHLYEAIALIEKEKRCRDFWLPHRTQCKNFIAAHLNLAGNHKNKILILGSGPLHEIPLVIIAREFKQVDLVDIVHLDVTKKSYHHLTNVNFIEADITELESLILNDKRPHNHVPSQFLNDQYDLVISANLLSQLAYHLQAFLEKKARPKLNQVELENFCNQVTLDHYNYLKKFSSPVILITDIETQLQDIDGRVVQTETPYINFAFPAASEEWWWNVAPIPEYKKELSIKMKVAAFILNF